MKKTKFLLKVDENLYGKVYINKKWYKDVCALDIKARPQDYEISIKQFKRNENGCFKTIKVNDELSTIEIDVKHFHFHKKHTRDK